MKFKLILSLFLLTMLLFVAGFRANNSKDAYKEGYQTQFELFKQSYQEIMKSSQGEVGLDSVRTLLHQLRLNMKTMDFWWRYSDPINYKLINGPLPVEWETEVFEKYEKPYKRIGKGLTLAEQALDDSDREEAEALLIPIASALEHLVADSLNERLESPDHFAHCNRLFLLNLAAIYTTGFECPDSSRILPELVFMLKSVDQIYTQYTVSFPDKPIDLNYLALYQQLRDFVAAQASYVSFDHFRFISEFVNPLYKLNSQWMLKQGFRSRSMMDYSINKQASSIFDKDIYFGQNAKGVFLRVNDPMSLKQINDLGKLLFNDPILSLNNQRTCASCHKIGQFYTDTSVRSAEKFNHNGRLARNTPSIINAKYNHLIMMDGKFIGLQEQALGVICNPDEMGMQKDEILKKIMSCKEYKQRLFALAQLTPQSPKPSLDHVLSALTSYYSEFSQYRSRFDKAMDAQLSLTATEIRGFNLFMSKAQCGTCHFIPHFNGVKPPYVGSEFEVLGVPDDTAFTQMGTDSGRYLINPAFETAFAFRTGTLKNIQQTAPYMHNGLYKTLRELIVFYNNGGGAGRGMSIANQTLSSEKLGLSVKEIDDLLAFLAALDEDIQLETEPASLPKSSQKELKFRKVGGIY